MSAPELLSDLDQVLAQAWGLLKGAVAEEHSPLHAPVLATVDLDGRPNARTVLLVDAVPTERLLRIDTDIRSPKFIEIARVPYGTLVFYHPQREIQLRIRTHIHARYDDPVALRAWDALPPIQRRIYMTSVTPGVAASMPTPGVPELLEERAPTAEESESGYRNFVVLEARVTHLDWLHITRHGHRRAAFRWDRDGTQHAHWLYP